MSHKCTNCSYVGDKLSKVSEGALWNGKCPVCGADVVHVEDIVSPVVQQPKPQPQPKVDMDLNGDGKFDKKDKSLAGKVLAESSTKPVRGRPKKK